MKDMTSKKGINGKWTMIAILIAIIVGSVALDQVTKYLAVLYLQPEGLAGSVHLWEGVFHFTYVRNYGAAWGMLENHRWVFMSFSTIAIIGISVYLFGFSKDTNWVKISLAMIVGGGVGNMIDRVWLGYVIDFLDFTLIDFPVFNVADSFVSVGAVMLMGYLIRDFIRELKTSKTQEDGKDASDDVGEP